MKTAVLYDKKDVKIEEVSVPEYGDNEVLIAIKAVGICGSDVHYYEHFGMGDSYRLTKPQILGHEPSGKIVGVGKNVKNVKVGQRVTVEPGETCGKCFQCKSGHYNLCDDVRFLSTPDNKGAFAEYLAMSEEMVFPIPDDMSYEIASLAEPLSVGIRACGFIEARPGKSLLILGVGSIGLMALIAAKSFGVDNIIVCDTQQNRLDVAKQIGAKRVINAKEQNLHDEIAKITGKIGVDCCIEAAGSQATCKSTIHAIRRGGKIAFVGIPREQEVPLNVFDIIDKEIQISGVFRYTNTYPTAVEILHKNMADLEKIITGRYNLEDTGLALHETLNNKQNTIKNVIVVK